MPVLGDGVKIAYYGGSPEAPILIPYLEELSLVPLPVPDNLETTTHGTDGYHTFDDGLLTVPDFTTKHQYDATNAAHLAMFAAQFAKDTLTIRVEIPTNLAKTLFQAIEMDAKVRCELSTPIAEWSRVTFTWKFAGNYDETDWATPAATEIT